MASDTALVSSEHAIAFERATVADAERLSLLFRTVYAESSHPCKDPRYIREILADPRQVWRLAKDDADVVASMAVLINARNRSAEIRHGASLPVYRQLGLATRLAQECLDLACTSPDCQVIYGFPRSRRMYRILNEITRPSMSLLGDDGGINVANGLREQHAVIGARNRSVPSVHVLPPGNRSIAASPFIQREVLRSFGPSIIGAYPLAFIASSVKGPCERDGIQYEYDAHSPSAAIEILGCDGFSPMEIQRRITRFLTERPRIQHARVAVLADKLPLIQALIERGFRMSAYLPGWWSVDDQRFDCVLMVLARFPEQPGMHDLGDLMNRFQQGIEAVASECGLVPIRS